MNFAAGGPILGPASSASPLDPLVRVEHWGRLGWSLRATCQCGAERQIAPYFVTKFFGGQHHFDVDHDPQRIAKRLLCGTCKKKGQAVVKLVVENANGS